jgi:hypothetical protein
MFHIPYNERKSVTNQRYSINGMPCLYLGISSYVCWEELGRPNLDTFWVSRFEVINKELKILNLSYTTQYVISLEIKNNKHGFNDLVDYILCWIIQCCCSITVKNKKRSFKEEYIIPQLIMQNLRSLSIDGIMYFSTKGDYAKFRNECIMKNLAFPADDYNIFDSDKKFDKNKYEQYLLSKKLKKSFKLTEPINMGLLNSVEEDSSDLRYKKESYAREIMNYEKFDILQNNLQKKYSVIELSNNNPIHFINTKFYNLEYDLICRKAEELI